MLEELIRLFLFIFNRIVSLIEKNLIIILNCIEFKVRIGRY